MVTPAFRLIARDTETSARRGVLATAHGEVDTPVFMPVGTRATVKGMLPERVHALGARIVLANAYHLFLRPGAALIEAAGGLHRFMAWHHPILTDSGGFQVFSLADTVRLSDEGVSFRSIVDGAKHHWTPEDFEGITLMRRPVGDDAAEGASPRDSWSAVGRRRHFGQRQR